MTIQGLLSNVAYCAKRSDRFALAALLLIGTGCDGLLEVENPTNLLDDDLEVPQLIATLSNSAEGNLVNPISQAFVHGEMIGDHIFHPSVQDFGILIDTGYRDRDNLLIEEIYTSLAAGRWIADNMVERLAALVQDASSHIGVAASYFWGAAARMTMASYFERVTYDAQAAITPAQAVQDAITRFQQAATIAAAAGNANLRAGALGGVARAYRTLYYEGIMDGGGPMPAHMQQAETFAREALAVHADFRVDARYGQPGPINGMFSHLVEQPYHRMTPEYANRADPVTGAIDPRIKHTGPESPGPRGEVRYFQAKFTARNAPLPISRAAEAQLIIAEARLLEGDLPGAVEWINHVRAASGLAPFSSSDASAIRQQLIYERDTELWLEGRRWEDHRYYNIIPRYWVEVNKVAGVALRWPMSVQERANNPNVGR